jgi:hypothetical protein
VGFALAGSIPAPGTNKIPERLLSGCFGIFFFNRVGINSLSHFKPLELTRSNDFPSGDQFIQMHETSLNLKYQNISFASL